MKCNNWLRFFLLYMGGVTISLSQLKITALQMEIESLFSFSTVEISWLMSIFTLSGVFLSIPGGVLVTKIGKKKLLLVVMSCTIIGNLLGYFSTTYWAMLISRVVEGISFSMIIMVGIVFINDWFKDDKGRGVVTGIWGTFSAAGSLIAMNIFFPMAEQFGIKSPWLLVAFLSSLLLIFYYFLFEEDEMINAYGEISSSEVLKVFKNRNLLFLALAQGCMAFVLFTFINIYPKLYTQFYNIDQLSANKLTGYFGLFGIPFGVVAGLIIDRTKRYKTITIVSFLIMTFGVILSIFMNTYPSFILQSFVLSMGASLSSSCIMIITPKHIKNKKLIGIGISFINFFYYISICIGTPIIMAIISSSYGWSIALTVLSGVSFIGMAFISVIKKPYLKEEEVG